MIILLKDIIQKYKTDIDLNRMSNNLKNRVMFTDEENVLCERPFEEGILENIEKPIYEEKGYLKIYIWQLKDYTLSIK